MPRHEAQPDANSTLRISYGTVKAFRPADSPFTVASQILRRNTGAEPFDAPLPILAAIQARHPRDALAAVR